MPPGSPSFWVRHRGRVLQALFLSAIWLLLSGKLETIYLVWGAVSVALVLWMSSRLRDVPLPGGEPWETSRIIIPRLIGYLAWQLCQIVKSGVYVAYVIIHPRMPIAPMIVGFTSRQPNALARVILGNSITLTPGTLTLDIDGSHFTVHALNRETEQDLVGGRMEAKVARLYLRECNEAEMCCEVEVIAAEPAE